MKPLLPKVNFIDEKDDSFEFLYGNIPYLTPGKGNKTFKGEELNLDLPEAPNVIPESLASEWLKDGLCPLCGLKGEFSHFQLVCKYHGVY